MANKKVFNPLTPPFDTVRDDLADLTTKSHTILTDIGSNTHTQIDSFIAKFSRGTATITAGNQTAIVNHGLSGTPYITISHDTEVIVKVTNKTATQFTLTLEAPQGTNISIDWIAML